MKQETPTNPANPANARSSTSEPKKEEAERTADTIKVLGGTANRGAREPTLLDSRGEPVKDAIKEAASGKESAMASTNAESAEIARKASAVVGQVGEGAKDVAKTASSAAGHVASGSKEVLSDAREGAKEVLSDAREGAKDLGSAAQKAAGHAMEAGKEVVGELKEGAKDLASRAVETAGEAKDVLQQASSEAAGIVKETKQRAIESVSSAVHQIGPAVRRANRATGTFVASNAVPISLLGFGAGWILMSQRRRSSTAQGEARASSSMPSTPAQDAISRPVAKSHGSDGGGGGAHVIEAVSDRVQDASANIREGIHHAAEEARTRAADVKQRAAHQIEHAREVVSERAAKLKKSAGERYEHTKQSTVHLAEGNPLLLVALSLGAGMGTAMLFPASKPEMKLLGPARDRFIDEASHTVSRIGSVARETARNLRENLRP